MGLTGFLGTLVSLGLNLLVVSSSSSSSLSSPSSDSLGVFSVAFLGTNDVLLVGGVLKGFSVVEVVKIRMGRFRFPNRLLLVVVDTVVVDIVVEVVLVVV